MQRTKEIELKNKSEENKRTMKATRKLYSNGATHMTHMNNLKLFKKELNNRTKLKKTKEQ